MVPSLEKDFRTSPSGQSSFRAATSSFAIELSSLLLCNSACFASWATQMLISYRSSPNFIANLSAFSALPSPGISKISLLSDPEIPALLLGDPHHFGIHGSASLRDGQCNRYHSQRAAEPRSFSCWPSSFFSSFLLLLLLEGTVGD